MREGAYMQVKVSAVKGKRSRAGTVFLSIKIAILFLVLSQVPPTLTDSPNPRVTDSTWECVMQYEAMHS